MKKILSAILSVALVLLLLAACSKAPANQQTTTPRTSAPATTGSPAQTAAPGGATASSLPADTYKIAASDQPNPITLKYTIDPSDIGTVKSVTLDIRNFGSAPIKPLVVVYIGGSTSSGMKEFEYDELPAGYKMIKTEVVNMKVSSLYEPNAIKADLKDVLQGKKKIGEDSKNYIAKASS